MALHIFSTLLLTFYRISSKRGSLLSGVIGIVVHDHWKPYYLMTGVLHALCNAHHLHELKALVEIYAPCQNRQSHLRGDLRKGFREEVRHSHVRLHRAERMLERASSPS